MKYRCMLTIFTTLCSHSIHTSAIIDKENFRGHFSDTHFTLNNTNKDGMNIRYYDESRFQSEYLSVLQQRNQRAYEALHAARENLHASVNSVRQTYLNIQSLSDKSFTGSEKVTVQEFFTAVHLYQQSIATTRDRIDSLALPASMLKYDPIELTSIIDFEPLQNHYRDQLKKLESACDHLISACPKTHKHLKTAACSPI